VGCFAPLWIAGRRRGLGTTSIRLPTTFPSPQIQSAAKRRTRAPSGSTTPLGGRPSTTQTMKKVDNSNVTASPRGGVGSNVMRIQSTATQVNAIRRSRLTSLRVKGEVKPGTDNSGATRRPRHGGLGVTVGVVGGSRLGRGGACEDGRTLRKDHPLGCRGEVRALIVAEKRGDACGAKGGRKANGRTT
jgi:hypothetical protein